MGILRLARGHFPKRQAAAPRASKSETADAEELGVVRVVVAGADGLRGAAEVDKGHHLPSV